MDDRGSSTAEFAVLLPVLAVMFALVLSFSVLGMQQIRVQQAAGAMARELARGEDAAAARSSGIRLAGDQARFSVSNAGGFATVRVSSAVDFPLVGPVYVHGQAKVATEQ